MSTATESKPASESKETPSVVVSNGLGMDELLSSVLSDAPEKAEVPAAPSETPSKEAPAKVEEQPAVPPAVIKDKPDEKKPEEKPPDELEKVNKRLKDTRDALTQERQQNVQMSRQLETLNRQMETLSKKIDGTWKEDEAPPPQQLVERAVLDTKVQVSEAAAIDKYGAEEVARMVTGENPVYRKLEKENPAYGIRVMNSKLPVLEAIKVVQEYEAGEKYGHDPATMRANIEKEVRAEWEEKYRLKSDAERKARPELPRGLRDVSGATAQDARQSEADTKDAVRLETLFPNFTKTAG